MKSFLTILSIGLLILSSCQSNKIDNDNKKPIAHTQNKATIATQKDSSMVIADVKPAATNSKPMTISLSDTNNAGGLNKALTPEEKARQENLRRAFTTFQKGIKLYKEGNLSEAIIDFKKVLELDPDNDKAKFNLGKIYDMQGQFDLAISYYNDAIHNNSGDSSCLVGIGTVYFDRGDFAHALEYYNQALKIAPGFGLAYYNRGTILGKQKDYPAALSDLNLAVKFDPANNQAFMNRGMAYFYLKDRDKACADWKKAAEMGNEEAKKAVSIYCTPKKPGENK